MAIIAKSSGDGQTFQPAPAGVHQAVCVDVIDRGVVEVTWQGQTKRQHKIDVAWQIDEARDDGKPFLVRKRYTLSLSEKANLRKDLESWRGKPFSREEEAGFDVERLIGVNGLVNVQHVTRGDKTYANVVSVMPLLKGMDKLVVRDYVRVVERPPAETNGHGEPNYHSDEPPPPSDADLGSYIDDVPFAPMAGY
jgi:hypothetical protein